MSDDAWKAQFLTTPEQGASQTLSFSRTPTVLLTFAANLFTRQNATALSKQFGVGAMDWRMLVMLTRHPGASVAQSAQTIGIDKAAVSRSLHRLLAKGLVTHTAEESDPRRKSWALTLQGAALHEEILAVVLERMKQQLNGFSQDEIAEFTRLLAKFHRNLGLEPSPD